MAQASNAPAAIPSSGPVARVQIKISAPDDIKSQIQQHLAQSLQAVGNVELVEETPRWTIEIVTSVLQDNEGRAHGLGLSFVILEHGPQMQMLVTMAQAWRYVMAAGFLQDKFIEQGMRQLVSRVDVLAKAADLTVMSEHKMCVIPLAKVGEACRDIAATLDARFLRASAASDVAATLGSVEQPTVAKE
ncbi:MAG: hypothetical protein JW993_12750 [Sedimentisphaerales bacterium]|nr:hypothetical protein [Sedimentisphaerales bacterium]